MSHIKNAADAHRAVAAAPYAPDGSRGIGPHRGSQFGAIPGDEYFKSVRGIEEVREALKKGSRLASVGTLETVLYQALKGDGCRM